MKKCSIHNMELVLMKQLVTSISKRRQGKWWFYFFGCPVDGCTYKRPNKWIRPYTNPLIKKGKCKMKTGFYITLDGIALRGPFDTKRDAIICLEMISTCYPFITVRDNLAVRILYEN